MTPTSVLIAIAILCITTTAGADTCFSLIGYCILDLCPGGATCIDNMCCITKCNNDRGDQFCNENAAKCNDKLFKNAMSRQCAKTCKTCGH